MYVGYHHHFHHRHAKKTSNQFERFMDEIVYIFGTLGSFIFVPQLIDVWTKPDITGVSIWSWVGLFCASLFWFFYGIVHKAKPLIFVNIVGGFVQFLVILGIVLHK